MWGNENYYRELLARRTWPTLFDALELQEKSNGKKDLFVNDPYHGFQMWLLGQKRCNAGDGRH